MGNLSLGRELPRLPTVSWRRGMWDSKTHYEGDKGRTLCGCRIPADLDSLESGDGEMCDACATIHASGSYLRRQPARTRRPDWRPPAPANAAGNYPPYLQPDDYAAYDESRRLAARVRAGLPL